MTRKSQQNGINDALKYLLLLLVTYYVSIGFLFDWQNCCHWLMLIDVCWMLTTRSCHVHAPNPNIVESELWVLEFAPLALMVTKPVSFARFRYLIHRRNNCSNQCTYSQFTRQKWARIWQWQAMVAICKVSAYPQIQKIFWTFQLISRRSHCMKHWILKVAIEIGVPLKGYCRWTPSVGLFTEVAKRENSASCPHPSIIHCSCSLLKCSSARAHCSLVLSTL